MNEQAIVELAKSVKLPDPAVEAAAKERLDNLTKPPGSLGRLEEVAWRIASIQGRVKPQIAKKLVYTLAGDHGVTEEGVSPYPKEVTPQMVLNFLHGGAAINVLTRHVGSEIRAVDMGVDFDFPPDAPGLIHRKVRRGTSNFTKGPAMSREEAVAALATGIALAADAKAQGVDLLGVGEMGIGNTTSAAALLSVFAGLPPEECVGRGTGIDDEGLKRKADAIRRGVAINSVVASDPVGVLAKVGGLEIAGMAGVFIGAAANGIPVIADGFISGAAALAAIRICPNLSGYLFLSHLSEEAGHKKLVDAMGRKPLLDFSMRLGEGTGAALAMTIIEAGCKVISEMATFAEAGVSNKE